MKKILFTLACAAMVCACDARHNTKANNPETTTTAANDEDDAMMAPDFTLEDIYGMPLTLSSFRGTYVLTATTLLRSGRPPLQTMTCLGSTSITPRAHA